MSLAPPSPDLSILFNQDEEEITEHLETLSINRPTSPIVRKDNPIFITKFMEKTGNEALDQALLKIGFIPLVYFNDQEKNENLFLLGENNQGYKILVKMNAVGTVRMNSNVLHLVNTNAPNLTLASNDIQELQLLSNGIAYFQEAGRLYYQSLNGQTVWIISEADHRSVPSDIPIPVVNYSVLVNNPYQVYINIKLMMDKILNIRAKRIRENIKNDSQILEKFYTDMKSCYFNINESLDNLYLSLIHLYIYYATHNQKFHTEHKERIKVLLSHKNLNNLTVQQKQELRNIGEEAIRTIIVNPDPKEKVKYDNLIRNIKERFNKIDRLIKIEKEITQISTRLPIETIELFNKQLTEMSISSWKV